MTPRKLLAHAVLLALPALPILSGCRPHVQHTPTGMDCTPLTHDADHTTPSESSWLASLDYQSLDADYGVWVSESGPIRIYGYSAAEDAILYPTPECAWIAEPYNT